MRCIDGDIGARHFGVGQPGRRDLVEAGDGRVRRSASIELPRGVGLLVVRRGNDEGARFPLETPETTVGRHPDSDVFLDDITVSRKHAVFVTEGQVTTVRDAGSLNGTYVNRSGSTRPSWPAATRCRSASSSWSTSGGRASERRSALSARSYLSIGDVLTLLRQEFPDVTISKIRFLESQGLVNPERTPRVTASSTSTTSSACVGSSANSASTSCPSR